MIEKGISCAVVEDSSAQKENQMFPSFVSTASSGDSRYPVQVGDKAPDFEAPAYQQGKFFQVRLSDYIGKWVMLHFYPGDFTFV